jgi:HPt (histidine-containing phosphotransfer) domain-containing protein
MSELMLEENEVTILIEAYISKMRESLALLFESIINKNYKLISKEAHTIKGSSANFRLHNIESIASEIESLSKSKTASDYKKLFTLLEIEVLKIKFIS